MSTMTHAPEPIDELEAPDPRLGVFGGVDTHLDTHTAVALSPIGALLGVRQFRADGPGYLALLAWLAGFGPVVKVGVEGTGAYGAGLTRVLLAADVTVIEVDRPDRATRRRRGKSDPIDAENAARAVLSGRASGLPKVRDGKVEALRSLHAVIRPMARERDKTLNRIKSAIVSAPDPLRESLRHLTNTQLVRTLAVSRPDTTAAGGGDTTAAARVALRTLARHYQHLVTEISALIKLTLPLIRAINPRLLTIQGVGPHVAAQLLITVGENPDRIHSIPALAALCGASPIPIASGKTDRHRLNRGGDRQANCALHRIVLTRMAHDERTKRYITERIGTGPGKKTKTALMRNLKRIICRELYPILTA